jgi:hypothetical protein
MRHYRIRRVKVSGFTILRDAVRLGYPFDSSIRSLLPLVDELVVGVGDGDDGTWEAVAAIADPRVRPFRSRWTLPGTGGGVLAEQTNLALQRCTGDWAVYLQADEVLHEDDFPAVRDAMRRHLHRRTEGLVFTYLHFWRDREHVADDWRRFYPRAVRAIKLGAGIESAGDACGFVRRRGGRTRGLLKADSHARVFHYGWCNPPGLQKVRVENLGREIFGESVEYPPAADIFPAGVTRRFTGSHPHTMAAFAAARSEEAAPAPWRWPAPLRAAAAIARAPIARHREARPFLPLPLTNAWWIAVDWWQARGQSRAALRSNSKTRT